MSALTKTLIVVHKESFSTTSTGAGGGTSQAVGLTV